MRQAKGFTLIELLLVLAIIGILSAVAIPALSGSRSMAQFRGDAQSNAVILRMALEEYRMQNVRYPPANTYVWKADGTLPTTNPIPTFTIKGNSKMDFTVVVPADRASYTLTIKNTKGTTILTADQNGFTGP